MEFRQLRYFLAVVEEGSVSAASRRVHVAQPALTRQIRLLEEDLETRLFDRHARGMHLTVAGRALVEEAQELLDRRDQIKARLYALGSGQTGKLSMGITVTHLWVPQVAELLGCYRGRYPSVALEVFPLLSGPQLERLREDRLDAGILYLDSDEQPGLDTRLLHRDHLILAVPEHSRWATSPPASLHALEGEDFIWGFRQASPVYYDRMLAHFQRHDFHPRVVQYGADNIAILSMVAAGLGIAIVPAASSWHPMPGIRFLHLPELDDCDMPLWFAWKTGNDSPALSNLIALVEALADTGHS
ncbi:LysR family transcriptional regulator [Litchfieldella qijiaojingensis]|uniref:LysR family transcriptional regulator n=1 Tax=Litchfieldella qijiaojingensis TaxID=980347 RepID=A0ABQ2Z9R3_9GAMM|nr:LysR family transcriptional regulator [Halomonas qijiaojingensis]GGY09215.1 LysR family transcriptional regulator [Halomonas qijiaojingensis]